MGVGGGLDIGQSLGSSQANVKLDLVKCGTLTRTCSTSQLGVSPALS